MHNGLTTSDKGALLDAKARGGEWLAREFFSNEIWVWSEKPFKGQFPCAGWYSMNRASPSQGCIGMLNLKIAAVSCELMNIDLALAQIAEMESVEKPTFEGYNVEHLLTISSIMREAKITPDDLRKCIDNFKFAAEIVSANIQKSMDKAFEEQARRILNSPYTEGEKI